MSRVAVFRQKSIFEFCDVIPLTGSYRKRESGQKQKQSMSRKTNVNAVIYIHFNSIKVYKEINPS